MYRGSCGYSGLRRLYGNIVLKYTEGLALSLFGMLKELMMKNTISKLAALMLKPGLRQFKRQWIMQKSEELHCWA